MSSKKKKRTKEVKMRLVAFHGGDALENDAEVRERLAQVRLRVQRRLVLGPRHRNSNNILLNTFSCLRKIFLFEYLLGGEEKKTQRVLRVNLALRAALPVQRIAPVELLHVNAQQRNSNKQYS
jgi:hypothetical protein